MSDAARAKCPNCAADYLVKRTEAAPRFDKQLLCTSCGGPLRNREGKFSLEYFRPNRSGANYKNGRQPKNR